MEFLSALWIPILVSAALVWIAASLIWTCMPHHKNDFSKTPDEDGTLDFFRKLNLPAGSYCFPHMSGGAGCNDPKMKELMEKGPAGHFTLWATPVNMGKNMVLSFITYLAVSVMIAYLAWVTLPHAGLSPGFAKVMQVTGTAGVLGYSFAFIPGHVWFGTKPRVTVLCIFDGIAMGLITGATFAWLWPT